MNLKAKGKGKLVLYGFDDISVSAIGDYFIEVSRTERKVNLVGFDDYISQKSIPIWTDTDVIDLSHYNIIYRLDDTPLLHRGDNSLISNV